MIKDILIGAIDLYSWEDVAPWIRSIKSTSFDGDVWLIAYRIHADVIAKIESHGVHVYQVEHDPFLRPINHTAAGPTQAHNLRFYHIWELLQRLTIDSTYQHVIVTDVRDVIFQDNPTEWLSEHRIRLLISPSEGIRYENEEWGTKNFLDSYGPVIWEQSGIRHRVTCNVGTIAGTLMSMQAACLQIYNMTLGRSYPSDQSSWNVMTHLTNASNTQIVHMRDGWAAQLGTTCDPTKSWLWEHLVEPAPVIESTGIVYAASGRKFVIVHQWDRVPHLKQIILRKYV